MKKFNSSSKCSSSITEGRERGSSITEDTSTKLCYPTTSSLAEKERQKEILATIQHGEVRFSTNVDQWPKPVAGLAPEPVGPNAGHLLSLRGPSIHQAAAATAATVSQMLVATHAMRNTQK